MADKLKLLPPFEWRGVKYPVTARSVSFSHESVQHKLQRRNKDYVEQNGAHNLVFSYTIPMRDELFRGPWKNIFSTGLQTLFRDCRRKNEGPLLDPIYGHHNCVPTSYNDETDLQRRDGTDIRLEFIHQPEEDEDDEQIVPNFVSVAQESESLNVAVQELADSTTDERTAAAFQQFAEEENLRSGTDLFGLLSGAGQQILDFPGRIDANLERTAFKAKKLEEIARQIASPASWQIQQDARALRDRANQARANGSQLRPARVIINESPRSLTSIAAFYGVSLQALLQANPGLTRSPTVPAGENVVIPNEES